MPDIHSAAVQFYTTCLHRYELDTQPACTTMHPHNKNWTLSPSLPLYSWVRKGDMRDFMIMKHLYM